MSGYARCSIGFSVIMASLLMASSVILAETNVDLSVSVASDASVVPINTNVTYTLSVENLSDSRATFVTISDTLPAEITFLSSSDACVVSDSGVECSIGDLAAGESVTVSYIVRVSAVGEDLANAVRVMAAETDPDMTNNSASVLVDVVIPEPVDIGLSGAVSPSTVDVSDEVEISLIVSNSDAAAAYLVTVDVVIPSQVEFVSSDDCKTTGIVVTCDVGTVAPDSPSGIWLIVRAVAPGNPVTISAIASHLETDPDPGNNGASLSFTINEPPPDSADLEFLMVPSAPQFIIGENTVITYTVRNLGPSGATYVRITDSFPDELVFVSSADCALGGSLTVCDAGNLGVNDIYTGSVTVTSNVVAEVITSSASVAADQFDPNLFNNVGSLSLPSVELLIATPSPIVVTATVGATATPVIITSTPLPIPTLLPVEPTAMPAAPPASEQGGAAGAEAGASGGDDTREGVRAPEGSAPSDIYGWRRYESADLIPVTGRWYLRSMRNASDNGYHESRDAGATLRYPFEGDGFRVGYRTDVNGAGIQVLLDGESLDIIDTNFRLVAGESDEVRQTLVTQPYWATPGYHLIDFVCLADGNGSEGCNIDYVEIFIGPPLPAAAQSSERSIAEEETPVVLDDVELVVAPPTRVPTGTPQPDSVISVDVIVSIDLNNNGQVDANEGVEGLTVRAVDVSNNTLRSTSVTDAAGFVRLTVSTGNDLILLIPVLGESFYVRNRGEALTETWNLLLDPANVPGLIP